MFTLGVRLWTGDNMFYPKRFSVFLDLNKGKKSMSASVNGKEIESTVYMMMTPGTAINGEIYELDIIADCKDENLIGVVEFDPVLGAFVSKINNRNVFINSKMNDFEIVGSIFDSLDEYRDLICNVEKFDEILENINNSVKIKDAKVENENTGKKENNVDKSPQNQKIVTQTKNRQENIPGENTRKKEQKKNEEKPKQKPKAKPNLNIPQNNVPESTIEDKPDEFFVDELTGFDLFVDGNNFDASDFDFDEDEFDSVNIFIYARGSKDEDSPGSYYYIMTSDQADNPRAEGKYEEITSKQRMEISAVIAALKEINERCNVTIHTSSQFLMIPFMKGWIDLWKENDWRKSSNEAIKNKELWEELYYLYNGQNIEWHYIKPNASIVEMLQCEDLSLEVLNNRGI